MSSSWSSDPDCVVVSPSLLKNVVVGPVSHCYSLGMDDFLLPEAYTDAEEPAPKKRKLSLSVKAGHVKENQPKDSNRYCFYFVHKCYALPANSINRWLLLTTPIDPTYYYSCYCTCSNFASNSNMLSQNIT